MITGCVEDVGCQSNDIAVLRRKSGRLDRSNFPLETFLSGFNQRPNNVCVGRVRGSSAKGVERFVIPGEPAVTIAPGKKPRSGTRDHVVIHAADTRHVRELQQSISGECLVTWIRSKPFVALGAGFKTGE